MDSENFNVQCSDITKEFKLHIPCKLAERVQAYASANNTIINSVVIEALDSFLREQKNRIG
jgi:hypothetical protein